jgi:hypothetical protein
MCASLVSPADQGRHWFDQQQKLYIPPSEVGDRSEGMLAECGHCMWCEKVHYRVEDY